MFHFQINNHHLSLVVPPFSIIEVRPLVVKTILSRSRSALLSEGSRESASCRRNKLPTRREISGLTSEGLLTERLGSETTFRILKKQKGYLLGAWISRQEHDVFHSHIFFCWRFADLEPPKSPNRSNKHYFMGTDITDIAQLPKAKCEKNTWHWSTHY